MLSRSIVIFHILNVRTIFREKKNNKIPEKKINQNSFLLSWKFCEWAEKVAKLFSLSVQK